MPSTSIAQQQAAGIAHAVEKGELPKSKLRGASKQMYKGMHGKGKLKKFAKTKHKGLPKHVPEAADVPYPPDPSRIASSYHSRRCRCSRCAQFDKGFSQFPDYSPSSKRLGYVDPTGRVLSHKEREERRKAGQPVHFDEPPYSRTPLHVGSAGESLADIQQQVKPLARQIVEDMLNSDE